MAIERKFVAQTMREFMVKRSVDEVLSRVGHSTTKLVRTPLGEKVLLYASRPGLVVGRGGQNITKLTNYLKSRFKLENPQVEIIQVENLNLDPHIVAEKIITSLERFGTQRFKGVGHRALTDVMEAGALGVEILISGRIPGSRAKTWRFYSGYLKKCGDIAVSGVLLSKKNANLKVGTIGVQVRIMPPMQLPDRIDITKDLKKEAETVVEEVEKKPVKEEKKAEKKTQKKTAPKKKKEAVAKEKPVAKPAVEEKKDE